jgi:exodeoxyribonuclease V alpha subunit
VETLKAKLHSIRQRRANSDGKTWIVGTFHNKPNGYFTGVGVLADTALVADLQLSLIGRWEAGKFGRQFIFTKYAVTRPVGPGGIAAFLQQAHNVGPVFADKAFGFWGDKAIQTIVDDPDAAAVKMKISPAKMHGIADFLRSKLAHIEFTLPLTELLHGIPFPKSLPETIVNTGMVDPVSQIQDNPFILMRHQRVGFPLCDQLRKRLGLPDDMPERIMAAAKHAFVGAMSVWQHKNVVIMSIVDTLGVSPKAAKQAIVSLIQQKQLRLHRDHLGLEENCTDEAFVCEWLIKKALSKPRNDWPELDPDINRLSKHQVVESHRAFRNGAVATLLGSAGVGKTHTAGEIIKCFPSYEVLAVAPTAKAAQRLGQFLKEFGVDVTPYTIHSALQARPKAEGGWHFLLDGTDMNKINRKLVVIDEVSMLDNRLARCLFQAIGDDTLVLMLGDSGQLPPVGRGALLRDWMAYCDRSAKNPFQYGELTDIRRNSGAIVSFAAALRDGTLSLPTPIGPSVLGSDWTREHNLQWCNLSDPAEMRRAIDDFAKKLVAGQIKDPDGVPIAPKTINRRMEGAHPIFKVGDRVINTENTYMPLAGDPQEKARIANGDIGYVVRSLPRSVIVRFESHPDEIVAPLGIGRGTLDLGYAITCHKAQGSQFPLTMVVLGDGFRDHMVLSREWLFTGVTRAQQLAMLVGPESALKTAAKKTSIWDRKSFADDWFHQTYKELT